MAPTTRRLRLPKVLTTVLALAFITACSSEETTYPDDDNRYRAGGGTNYSDTDDTIFGPGGLNLLGGDESEEAGTGGGIGVNTYLWRASLDTISFMPLATADPFGGVIITDWYAPPESQTERFKVNVFIIGRQLRADGVRASVFRQNLDGSGQWVDAKVDAQTATDLENAILNRARQLRIASLQ